MLARSRSIIPVRCPTQRKLTCSSSSSFNFYVRTSLERIDYLPKLRKEGERKPRRLIKLPSGQGKHPGKWDSEYVFTFNELQLQEYANDGEKEAQVFINLSITKHAGFGISVEGNITSSLTSTCSKCGSSYCREVDTNFDTWVLPQRRRDKKSSLDIVGGEDPDVIYVKPGQVADIDSVVRHTLRLTLSTYAACSELCKNGRTQSQG